MCVDACMCVLGVYMCVCAVCMCVCTVCMHICALCVCMCVCAVCMRACVCIVCACICACVCYAHLSEYQHHIASFHYVHIVTNATSLTLKHKHYRADKIHIRRRIHTIIIGLECKAEIHTHSMK